MIVYFLSNISAKYYENPTMLSRVIAKNIGDVFFETQCIGIRHYKYNTETEVKKSTKDCVNLCHFLAVSVTSASDSSCDWLAN